MRDRFGDYLSVKIKIINEKKEKRVMLFLNRILYILKKKSLFNLYGEYFLPYKSRKRKR